MRKRIRGKLALSICCIIYCAVFSQPASLPEPINVSSAAQVQNDGAHPLPFKAGDALVVITYPDTNAFPSGFYPIDGDGFADFPIIGYTQVTGMSPEALSKLLSEKYVDFMRYPMMNIRPVLRISLNGGFFRPGHYWIDPHATLWEALQKAGGTQRADGYKQVKWERNNVVVNDNLAPVLQEGKSLYQIGFTSGDQITVLQQPYRSRWEMFRSDIIPLMTTSLSIVISALTLYYTAQQNN